MSKENEEMKQEEKKPFLSEGTKYLAIGVVWLFAVISYITYVPILSDMTPTMGAIGAFFLTVVIWFVGGMSD